MKSFGPKNFKFHSRVKKCHFGKIFLSLVPINIQKDWKAKLESAYSFMLKYSKIKSVFSKKATKIDEIFTVDLTACS